MLGSVHFTNGGSGGMKSSAGLELPYPWIPRTCFRTKLLRGESNVTLVTL